MNGTLNLIAKILLNKNLVKRINVATLVKIVYLVMKLTVLNAILAMIWLIIVKFLMMRFSNKNISVKIPNKKIVVVIFNLTPTVFLVLMKTKIKNVLNVMVYGILRQIVKILSKILIVKLMVVVILI